MYYPKGSPTVSVIIPTYNSAVYICEAIESIFNQDYKNIEIIVIDDGSIDDTKEVLKKYQGRIKYFYQKNRGVSAARNYGISISTGEYICFLDSDDHYERTKISTQLKYLIEHIDYKMIYSDLSIFKNDVILFESYHKKNSMKGVEGFIFNDLILNNLIHTITVMVSRDIFYTVGLFDESLITGEDYDMWLRISLEYKIGYIPAALASYRRGHESLTTNKNIRNFDYTEPVLISIIKKYLNNYRSKFKISSLKLRKRFFQIYFDSAWSCFNSDNFFLAKKYFEMAIYYRPYYIKLYVYFLICYWNILLKK